MNRARIPGEPADLHPLELRIVTDGEFPAFAQAVEQAFGEELTDEQQRLELTTFEPERFFGVFTPDGEVVGTCGAFSFDLALPGGEVAGCAGVTAVGVRQDHRRRGLLTAMMARLLAQADDLGEPFAALFASEGAIYGRYGFGPAIPTLRLEVPRARLDLRTPVDTRDVRLLPVDAALRELPELYRRARSQRPGLLSRTDAWWYRLVAHDPLGDRDGAGPRMCAMTPNGGYALYRLRSRWEHDAPCGTVVVEELVSLYPMATAQLWSFLAATDLATTVTAAGRPSDDPLRSLVRDPVQVRTREGPAMYLRLLDVPAALAARRYLVDDTVVLGVTDPLYPTRSGSFRLQVNDGVGRAERTDAHPDLHLGVEELGMLYLGGVRSTVLAQAGRIDAPVAGAIQRLERLFAGELAPVQCSEF